MNLKECNAVIRKATLSDGDRGYLAGSLELDFGHSFQGFGGYALYLPASSTNHEPLSCAGHFIWRSMEIAGVSDWSSLPGKAIRVRHNDSGNIHAIGHIIKDDWFCPSEDFKPKNKE